MKNQRKQEISNFIQLLQDRVLKQVFFRKWMNQSNVHREYKARDKKEDSFDENQQQEVKIEQQPKKQIEKATNLKIGDIVYLKSYLSDEHKGIIAGDGIASNKLECCWLTSFKKGIVKSEIKSKSIQLKLARLIFQKCMFRVVSSKKYFYQKQWEQDSVKIQDEQEENEMNYRKMYGSNIIYGQEVQLEHIYSNCTVTLNPAVLAKQACCRELSLEEESNENSNFKFLSLNRAKKEGEPILYGDQVILESVSQKWYLGVEKLKGTSFADGLEVNANEHAQALKICQYLDNKMQSRLKEQAIEGTYIQSGDIITIKSRNMNGFLSMRRKNMISQYLKERKVEFTDYDTNVKKYMIQDLFDLTQLRNPTQLHDMYELYINDSECADINSLWEIQLKDAIKFYIPSYSNIFLLKHVATGCFLAYEQDQLIFTYDGMLPACSFFVKSKKLATDYIPYSESQKIQSVYNPNLILKCDTTHIAFTSKTQKQDSAKTIFLFNPAPTQLATTANRIRSLTLYLFQFYVFLQDWGMAVKPDGEVSYEYTQAFQTQKMLFDEVRQLFQSLENLEIYLKNDDKEVQKAAQIAVRENGIINLLCAILHLISFMIYGSSQKRQKTYDGFQEEVMTIPDKSPQKIAKLKLDPDTTHSNAVHKIYTILLLCIQNNSESSNYLMKLELKEKANGELKFLNFLLQQLKYHREDVSKVLKESVRYTQMEESGYLDRWIEKLEPITEDNIQDQSLVVELLSLIMIDPYETPIKGCQDLCRKLLFKSDNCQFLLRFNPVQNDTEKPSLRFFNDTYRPDVFYKNNELFCITYIKYSTKHITISKLKEFDLGFVNYSVMRKYISKNDEATHMRILSKYEDYVLNVLNLYCSLCKGRNHKSINKLMRLNITKDLLEMCIRKFQGNQLRYERCMLNLYNAIYLDVDPLIHISDFTNTTFLIQDIKEFQIDQPSGYLFIDNSVSTFLKHEKEFINFRHQGTDAQKIRTYAIKKVINKQTVYERMNSIENNRNVQLEDSNENLQDQIPLEQELFQQPENQQLISESQQLRKQPSAEPTNTKIFKHYIEIITSQRYPDHLRQTGHMVIPKFYARFQLEFMFSVLKLLRLSIDLGYNDLYTNEKLFLNLQYIFKAMILSGKFKDEIKFDPNERIDAGMEIIRLEREIKSNIEDCDLQSYHWLITFIIWTTQCADDALLTNKLYIETISVFTVLQKLKQNLAIVQAVQQKLELKGTHKKIFAFNINDLIYEALYACQGRSKVNEDILKLLICNFSMTGFITKELRNVEIIDDQEELYLYTVVNGNLSDRDESFKEFDGKYGINAGCFISPKELDMKVKKTLKYLQGIDRIIESKQLTEEQGRRLETKLRQNYAQVKNYLEQLCKLLRKCNSHYKHSLQNIIRNAGIHTIFKKLFIRAESEDPSMVDFYKILLRFFNQFVRENERNQNDMLQNIEQLLDIGLINQPLIVQSSYQPIKVSTLIHVILSRQRESNKMEEIITVIINRMIELGDHLIKISDFFRSIHDDDYASQFDQVDEDLLSLDQQPPGLIQVSKRQNVQELVYMVNIIQSLNILKSLNKTIVKPQKPILANKHNILTKMLQTPFLHFCIQPANFFEHLKSNKDPTATHQNTIRYYYQMKLHATSIRLLTECCHYYRLGIQETQRTLLYEQLKSILLQPTCLYIIKRAYILCLFEVYINKVTEGDQANEVVEVDEVGDILSRIIIPDLDQKQVYRFLEGLVRSSHSSESQDLKDQITKQKKHYFASNKEFRDQTEDFSRHPSILKDSSEFWKYIRSQGLINFLVCSFDEMKDRVDLEKSEESNLADEFSIVKNSIQKMKDIFNVLERDFRIMKSMLHLDEYRLLIQSIEEIIPQRKITKFGKNFRIGFGGAKLQFEKYDTQAEDVGGEKKIQEQENVLTSNSQFKRNLKIYFLRHKLSVNDLLRYVEQKGNPQMEDIEPLVNHHKQYMRKEDLNTLRQDEMLKIRQEKQLKDQQSGGGVEYKDWDIFKLAMKQLFQIKHDKTDEELDLRQATKRIDDWDDQQILLNNDLQLTDGQIQQLLLNLKELIDSDLAAFVRRSIDIFENDQIYLIKLCRILLESDKPSEDEMDLMRHHGGLQKKKFERFKERQITIANCDIDCIALKMMQSEDKEDQNEALKVLIILLEYGNSEVQDRILEQLRNDIQVQKDFFSYLRQLFYSDLNFEVALMKESESRKTIFEIIAENLLKLLQMFCENVQQEFQEFLSVQNKNDQYTSNTDVVMEVCNFLSFFLEDDQLEFRRKNDLIHQGIETLVEFSTGYEPNKKKICMSKRLFTLLNSRLIEEMRENIGEFAPDPSQGNPCFETLSAFLRLLLAMTRGNNDVDSLSFLFEIINSTMLIFIMKKIYEQRIEPKYYSIIKDKICTEQDKHKNCENHLCKIGNYCTDEDIILIESGFNIFIFFMIMVEKLPEKQDQLGLFLFDEKIDEDDIKAQQQEEQEREEEERQQKEDLEKVSRNQVQPQDIPEENAKEAVYKSKSIFEKEIFVDIKEQVNREFEQIENQQYSRIQPFFQFYRQFIGRIEILQEEQLHRVYFQKPFLSKFITPKIKEHIIYHSNRESDEDRYLSVLDNLHYYEKQMVHSQFLAFEQDFLNYIGPKYWRALKDLSFFLCFVIVVLLILDYEAITNTNQQSPIKTVNTIVTIIQLVLNTFIVIFSAIERYPISITYQQLETNQKKILILKKEAGFKENKIVQLYHDFIGWVESCFEPDKVARSWTRKAILIFFDFDNFYNVIIFALTVFAFNNPFIYAVLLLDIVKRSEDLQNIIRSITQNYQNLAKFTFLGLVGLLLYAILAFNYLKDFFNPGNGVYGSTFILAVTTTINFGLRNGGGLGDSFGLMPEPSKNSQLYWSRYFFDLSFFILVNVLFLQMVFGIILDTFGQLRDERQELIKEIEGKCFVCSLSRNYIETKGETTWFKHIYLEHNVLHMLCYLIMLKNKNLNDCDALEKYVKTCIENKKTDFFPLEKALSIEE